MAPEGYWLRLRIPRGELAHSLRRRGRWGEHSGEPVRWTSRVNSTCGSSEEITQDRSDDRGFGAVIMMSFIRNNDFVTVDDRPLDVGLRASTQSGLAFKVFRPRDERVWRS
jgi:hypothetical protein